MYIKSKKSGSKNILLRDSIQIQRSSTGFDIYFPKSIKSISKCLIVLTSFLRDNILLLFNFMYLNNVFMDSELVSAIVSIDTEHLDGKIFSIYNIECFSKIFINFIGLSIIKFYLISFNLTLGKWWLKKVIIEFKSYVQVYWKNNDLLLSKYYSFDKYTILTQSLFRNAQSFKYSCKLVT